jgi:hypothetical protein
VRISAFILRFAGPTHAATLAGFLDAFANVVQVAWRD